MAITREFLWRKCFYFTAFSDSITALSCVEYAQGDKELQSSKSAPADHWFETRQLCSGSMNPQITTVLQGFISQLRSALGIVL